MKNKFYKTTSRKIKIKQSNKSMEEEVIDKAMPVLAGQEKRTANMDEDGKHITFSLLEIDDLRNKEFVKPKVQEILFKEHDGQLF